jgi:hypothetical protein
MQRKISWTIKERERERERESVRARVRACVRVPKELHTADISFLLNYAICIYTATKQLHNFPFSFPVTGDKGNYHCMQHLSPGVNAGLQWIVSLQFISNYTVLLTGKGPTPMAKKNYTSNSFMNVTHCEDPV